MRRRHILIALVAVATFGVDSACTGAEVNGNGNGDLQRDLDAIVAQGASRVHALVRVEGRSDLVRTAGPQAANGDPVLSEYEIGISTETFVATVLLQLVGEGRLSLDDSIDEHLPHVVAEVAGAVTLRHLLQHTSGLPDHLLGDQPTEPAGLVAEMTSRPLLIEPGTAWGESNTDYVLAGMIVEHVTGAPWDQEINKRIIEPLGITHTAIGEQADRPDWIPWGPDGGTLTTPTDTVRFFEALLGGELLAPDLLAEMKQTVPTGGADGARHGLGIVWRPLSCNGGYWGHASSIPGYRSIAAFTEDASHSVVLSNATVDQDESAVDAQHDASLELIDTALCSRAQ